MLKRFMGIFRSLFSWIVSMVSTDKLSRLRGGSWVSCRKRLNEKGMTLIEIMIVLVILASIGGLAITTVNTQLRKSRVRRAEIMISEIGKALDTYYTDCATYPPNLEGLMSETSDCPNWGPEAYLRKIPKDPWNNDFIYEVDGSSYEIVSLGEGGREGGEVYEKDISSQDK